MYNTGFWKVILVLTIIGTFSIIALVIIESSQQTSQSSMEQTCQSWGGVSYVANDKYGKKWACEVLFTQMTLPNNK